MTVIDTSPVSALILQAATEQAKRLVGYKYTSQDWRADPMMLLENCLNGKIAEAAYAIAIGKDVNLILDDDFDRPDFITLQGIIDVKAVIYPKRHMNVKAKDLTGIDILVGVGVQTNNWRAKIHGQIPASHITRLPVSEPTPGRSTPYWSVPLELLQPVVI
jgi:hypothetical protein